MPMIAARPLGNPTTWQAVPLNTTNAKHPNAIPRAYTLNASSQNGRLNFWFDPSAPVPKTATTTDGPLDIRAVDPENRIELTLADGIEWWFPREVGVVMVGAGTVQGNPIQHYVDVEFDGPADQP